VFFIPIAGRRLWLNSVARQRFSTAD